LVRQINNTKRQQPLMQNLEPYIRIIEKGILKIGIDPETVRSKQPASWILNKGSIQVIVTIFRIEQDPNPYIQIVSPLMAAPKGGNVILFNEILSLNHGMFGAAFSIFKGNIYLKTIRELEGLDVSEVYSAIIRVGNYADHYDNYLREKYPSRPSVGFQPNSTEIEDNAPTNINVDETTVTEANTNTNTESANEEQNK